MTEEFTINIASDSEHEKVFAEVYCQGKFVVLISQEQGLDELKIEFPPPGVDEATIMRAVNLDGFHQALISARRRLAGQNP